MSDRVRVARCDLRGCWCGGWIHLDQLKEGFAQWKQIHLEGLPPHYLPCSITDWPHEGPCQ